MALNADRIRKNVRKLGKVLKKARKRPNPEVVHGLRTHARRFESLVDALSLDSKANERRLLKRVKRIRKSAGKVRDLDVLTSDLGELHVKGEQNCLVILFEYLGARRHKHAARLVRSIERDKAVILKRMKKTSRRIDKLLGSNGQTSSQNRAMEDAMASAMARASELATPGNLTRGNLHEYRLKIKELEDVLQMSDDEGHAKFVEALDKVKDAIGEWHDWEELIGIAVKILDHGPSCKLLHELRVVSSRKYESALTLANKLRKNYLKLADSSSGAARSRPGQPVIKAVSKIAA